MSQPIPSHSPQIRFTLKEGSIIKIEALNYPGVKQNCQGLQATKDIETALTKQRLLPDIEETMRVFKSPERVEESTEEYNQQQQYQ